jgi:phage terminase small subunit
MTKRMKTPMAPRHLTAATRAWWRDIVDSYELEAHQLRLLTLAGEAFDRCEQARQLLDREGLVLGGREGGSRPHPAIAIERDSRNAFARLVDQLDLETTGPKRGPGRPATPITWKGLD